MNLQNSIKNLFCTKQKTLSLAESCTGGLLTNGLTDISGSSQFLKGSVIAYHNDIKIRILQVPSVLIKKHGAVSAPVALAMAKNIRRIFKTDFSLSITGIAGPSGGTPQKPVGLVFIAIASAKRAEVQSFQFKGSRLKIKKQSAQAGLQWLRRCVEGQN